MTQMSLVVGLGERACDITICPILIDQVGSMLGKIAADWQIIVVNDNLLVGLHLHPPVRWVADSSPQT